MTPEGVERCDHHCDIYELFLLGQVIYLEWNFWCLWS